MTIHLNSTKPSLQIAIAIIWKDGEILLSKRLSTAAHLPDVWEFPGGKIEDGETPMEAAIREAREEVGLEVEVTTVYEPIEWQYETRRVTLHPFGCRIVGGQAEALEVAQVKFVTSSALNAADFPPANASLIALLRRGNTA